MGGAQEVMEMGGHKAEYGDMGGIGGHKEEWGGGGGQKGSIK